MYSNILGETIRHSIKNEHSDCSCRTVTNNVCSHNHKFLYQLSNMDDLLLCCGVVGHRRQIMNKCKDGVVANVYRYMYSESDYEGTKTSLYTTVAVAVDNTCDAEYPMFISSLKLSTLKESLRNNILSENEKEITVKNNVRDMYTLLDELNKQLYLHKTAQNEMKKTLSYIKTHTHYKPISILNKVNDVCSICQEEMYKGDSGRLYECSHYYHNKCIEEWFRDKEIISCPCCRQNCDIDNYFIFKKV